MREVVNQNRMKISIILPTFNERQNIDILVPRLQKIISQMRVSPARESHPVHPVQGEILIIDDNSLDGTYERASAFEKQSKKQPVRAFLRKEERGLSSAVLFGMRHCNGEYILVMDADLQHDESRIPDMLQRIQESDADICVGSRTVDGGSYGQFGALRITASKMATRLAHFFLPFHVKDPMSGFFILRQQHYQQIAKHIRPIGFKILLDILAAEPSARIAEVPIVFKNRRHGQTKVGIKVIAAFVYALVYYWSRNLRRF